MLFTKNAAAFKDIELFLGGPGAVKLLFKDMFTDCWPTLTCWTRRLEWFMLLGWIGGLDRLVNFGKVDNRVERLDLEAARYVGRWV